MPNSLATGPQRVLVVRGDLNSYSGYAYATRLYLEWLEEHFDVILGVDLHGHPTRHVTVWPYPLVNDDLIDEVLQRPDVEMSVLTISTPDNFRSFRPAKSIGLFFWETNRLGNPGWIDNMNKVDEVWVPTRFMLPMLENEGVVTPVIFTPCPLPVPHAEHYTSAVPDLTLRQVPVRQGVRPSYSTLKELRNESNLLFLSTNSFIPRKGFPVLAEEWLNVVGAHPNATLILKVTTVDVTETADRLYDRVETLFSQVGRRHDLTSNRVFVCTDSLLPETMRGLHETCDAFLSMSFGEGLGLGLFENLLSGKPVICPRHTSFNEFLPANYRYFVQTEVANFGLADPIGVNPISAHWGVPREGSLLETVNTLADDLSGDRVAPYIAEAVQHFRTVSAPRALRGGA